MKYGDNEQVPEPGNNTLTGSYPNMKTQAQIDNELGKLKEHGMNEVPEGLDYDSQKRDHESNMLEQHLEAGKYATGATPSAEHEKAETLRMLGCGSHDPYYKK